MQYKKKLSVSKAFQFLMNALLPSFLNLGNISLTVSFKKNQMKFTKPKFLFVTFEFSMNEWTEY